MVFIAEGIAADTGITLEWAHSLGESDSSFLL